MEMDRGIQPKQNRELAEVSQSQESSWLRVLKLDHEAGVTKARAKKEQ